MTTTYSFDSQQWTTAKNTAPKKIRIAIVKLESKQYQRSYYWTNEEYLKTQQSYLDLFSKKFEEFHRVINVSVIPELLISSNPTFVNIRESAVRTQADLVAIYSITSEIYSNYKIFSSTDIKVFVIFLTSQEMLCLQSYAETINSPFPILKYCIIRIIASFVLALSAGIVLEWIGRKFLKCDDVEIFRKTADYHTCGLYWGAGVDDWMDD
jgi:hypothetical protein